MIKMELVILLDRKDVGLLDHNNAWRKLSCIELLNHDESGVNTKRGLAGQRTMPKRTLREIQRVLELQMISERMPIGGGCLEEAVVE